MTILLKLQFFVLAATAVAAWFVTAVAVFSVPYNTIGGPLRGPAFLRAADTFRWIFRRDLVLPMLYPENLTPRGRVLRKRALIAGAVSFLCCFVGIACGIVGATALNGR
ncbi:MAG: hypothetical protein SGJ07_03435 [Rhodospirillaceae bacterium]|nr:hypothetical protein [Rhodospirillaceae bacterium]